MIATTINSVLIDSCIWIKIWRGDAISRNFIQTAIRRHYVLVVPENVITELCRKLGRTKEAIVSWIMHLEPEEIRLIRDKPGIGTEADRLRYQYSFCHYPDNRLLAISKDGTCILVTYDRQLLQSANFEGVLACRPEEFGRYVA